MKVFLENYNGVLDTVEDALSDDQLTDNPHEADVFLLWQDVRGVCRELALLAKNQLNKPVLVMQHGRGCTRDYDIPNKFELIADKIMVWGPLEKDRLIRCGIKSDRIVVTGCPLLPRLKQSKERREGKNILLVPVIAQKEEPENILVYAALKKWESEKLVKTVMSRFGEMKRAWAWENNELREIVLPDGTREQRLWKRDVRPILPRWLTYGGGLINVKLSGVHDLYQYQAPLITTSQNDPNLIDGLAQLLPNIDAMVCLEEGTMQLMAHYLGIPVILVDIFSYVNYGGCADYDKVEKIRTAACYWTKNLNSVGRLLDHALAHPRELDKPRKLVCENEGGISFGDPLANILECLKSAADRPLALV